MRLPRLTTAACLLLTLSSLAPARAQAPTPIRYGQTVTGEITAETPCLSYTFDGAQGDALTADMQRTSGSLDGVLWLRDARGDVLATDDDRPSGGLNPLLAATLPADGGYTLAACRLEHPQMRVTTGTFALTLTAVIAGEAAAGAAPGGDSLSDSVFGAPSPTAAPPASATPSPGAPFPLGALFGGLGQALANGSHVAGRLDSAAPEAIYRLPVGADELVALTWTRVAGEGAPTLRVVGEDGRVLAGASAPDPAPALDLTFRAPRAATLTLTVGQRGGATLDFALDVRIEAAAVATPSAPTPTPTPAGYLSGACASEGSAVSGLGSTRRLIDVYTAAGDSYYPDQLTRTAAFRADDDLNLVFRVQNVTGEVAVAGVFCAPDGEALDAGESTFSSGGQYLIGLDWEALGDPWTPGDWYAELYVDGAWELSLRFTVAAAD